MEQKKCVFCYDLTEYSRNPSERGGTESCDCPTCGEYKLVNYNSCIFINTERRKKVASFLYYNKNNARILLLPQDYESKNESCRVVTEADIDNWYPKTFHEKIDKILLKLAVLNIAEGEPIELKAKEFQSLFFLPSDYDDQLQEKLKKNANKMIPTIDETILSQTQAKFVSDYLSENNLVDFSITKRGFNATIKPDGYAKIYDLQKNQSNNKKVFIAMSFDPKHKPIMEAIKTALRGSGYLPNPICDKPHNNWIMSEILAEIKDSKFVIADLTGQNLGVYYEAGFAEALNKEVILTCPENGFKKIHFDLKQKFIIKYSNEEELIERLMAQIKGTVGVAI